MLRSALKLSKTTAKKVLRIAGKRVVPLEFWGTDWVDDMLHFSSLCTPKTTFDTIIDVGANIGQTCLELRRRLRPNKIYAFEPVTKPSVS